MSPTGLHREDAAWLAGLFDGEACFDAPNGNPRIRLKMSDLDVVLRAAGLMEARTHRETVWSTAMHPRKPLLVAQITGDRAVHIMREVLPWLGSRRSARVTEIILNHQAKAKAKAKTAHRRLAAAA